MGGMHGLVLRMRSSEAGLDGGGDGVDAGDSVGGYKLHKSYKTEVLDLAFP